MSTARSRLTGALLLIAALLTTLVSAPTASAVIGPSLVGAGSGRCLDVVDNNATPGTEVQIWDCNGQVNQGWEFTAAGEMRTFDGTRCLDAYNFGTAPGTRLVSWNCTGAANQKFRRNGDGTITATQSNLCLDVLNHGTANGTRVILWSCTGAPNQRWSTGRSAYPNPGYVTGDIGVHDPTVVKRPDGSYLVAYTGDGIPLKTSTDRIAFRNIGAAFPGGTPWANAYTNNSPQLWAPDISFRNGQYYMYYSASTFGSMNSAIFLATSPSGNPGTWTHRGLVVSSRPADNFNAIDPNLVVDDQGRWWLNFGSFWSGIKLIPLDPATGLRQGTSITSIAYNGAIEAPFIVKRGNYYYQYVSFDYCCRGAQSNYRIMVGRSTSVTGPYVDRSGRAMTSGGGTEILAGHGNIHGPGHQAVLADTDGDILFYHYYADNGAPLLGINRLVYDAAGWPTVV
ncbi:family 43 glycosylhydrolase [Saccharothrix hoggarensis]|uniref:Family 43 glycosylhydrolase n=1 Tax=Saccharothrix hoggarensis TaxID=913853 RepID=A0ABW3QSX4_9PSEU